MATEKLSGTPNENPYGASNTDSYAEAITQQYADAVKAQSASVNSNVAEGTENLSAIGQRGAAALQESAGTAARDYAAMKAVESGIEQNDGNRQQIGHSQYGIAENSYDQQRASIEAARAQLEKNVSRQVADLKAQGEYAKADAALQAAQQKFQQIYADALRVDTNLRSNYEYQTGLQREDAAIQREQDASDTDWLRKMGEALLSKGVTPPDNMLAAMGLDSSAVQQYINAVVSAYSGYVGGGSGKTSSPSTSPSYDAPDDTPTTPGNTEPAYSTAYNSTIAKQAYAVAKSGDYQKASQLITQGYSDGQFSAMYANQTLETAKKLYNQAIQKNYENSKPSAGTKGPDYWNKYYG